MLNALAAKVFDANLTQVNLVTKTDFEAKLKSLNRKMISNKTKHLIVQNELKISQTFNSVYFRDKSLFQEDGTQHYLVFQSKYRF